MPLEVTAVDPRTENDRRRRQTDQQRRHCDQATRGERMRAAAAAADVVARIADQRRSCLVGDWACECGVTNVSGRLTCAIGDGGRRWFELSAHLLKNVDVELKNSRCLFNLIVDFLFAQL